MRLVSWLWLAWAFSMDTNSKYWRWSALGFLSAFFALESL